MLENRESSSNLNRFTLQMAFLNLSSSHFEKRKKALGTRLVT